MIILIYNTDQQTQAQSLVDAGALESECLRPNPSSASDKPLNLDESQKLQAPVLSCVKQGRGGESHLTVKSPRDNIGGEIIRVPMT